MSTARPIPLPRSSLLISAVCAGLLALAGACSDGDQGGGARCGDGLCEGDEAPHSCPADCPICNNDGVCTVEAGENGSNCPADCPLCVVDGHCDVAYGETRENCSADCDGCNHDGVCDVIAGETPGSCPGDCPACIEDGVCDGPWGETRESCPGDCSLCNADGTCDEAEGEDAQNCPADCAAAVDDCDLAAMQAGRPPWDYLVNQLDIPTTSAEAANIGFDLNGDDVIDNKLGTVMAMLMANGAEDPNTWVNTQIGIGGVVIPLRYYVDSWSGDATTMMLAYEGKPTNTPPVLNGTDVVEVVAGSPTDLYLCGPYSGGSADMGPGVMLVPIPLYIQTVFVPLQRARVMGAITQAGWTDVVVGGGMTAGDVDQIVLPALVDYFNFVLAGDPAGGMAETVMVLFDGSCSDLGGACAGVVAGQGDCVENLPTDPNPITLTEVRCNAMFASARAPDVDSDGDGVDDLLSVGFQLQAVPATILLP